MAKILKERKDIGASDQWNLASLFGSDGDWEADFSRFKALIDDFGRFRGSLSGSAKALAECLSAYSAFGILAERLGEYASLKQCQDEGDSANRERLARYAMEASRADGEMSWLEVEIQAIDDGLMSSYLEDPAMAEYGVFLRKLLRFKPHILSEAEERLLALQSESAGAVGEAFSVLTNVDFSFGRIDTPEGPVDLSQSSYHYFMEHKDRRLRQEAYGKFYGLFDSHKHTLAELYQGSVLRDKYLAKVRGYPSARAKALFPDKVGEDVYDNLIATVGDNLGALHDYYELKRQALGVGELRHYDVYAPIVAGQTSHYPYEKAVDTVCAALSPLGDAYVETLRSGLLGSWVDRYENKGKHSGAFSSGGYSSDPFILLNYQEDVLRDLYTMAHEGGHSMHSHYSAANNPFLSYGYTIFEAEVASTFNEELVFARLYSEARDPAYKAYLLNMRVDETIGTLYRQTMFAEFEARSHQLVESGQPLTLDVLRSEYRALLGKYFGPSLVFEEQSDLEGLRIPHFYRAFYVYKYATGISAAMALSKRVLTGGQAEREDYFKFLKSGGSRFPIESLKVAGVDMSKPEPIQAACRGFAQNVAELRRCLSELGAI